MPRSPRTTDAPATKPHKTRITGPKLSATQLRTVQSIIATHWETRMIQDVLADEHPDIPTLTDDGIRHHRRQLDQKLTDAARVAQETILRTGLSQKVVRIANLQMIYTRLYRSLMVPLRTREGVILNDPETNKPILFADPAVSKELREVLKQIASEMGQLSPDTQITINATNQTALLVAPEQAKQLIAEGWQTMIETLEAERIAEDGLPPIED